MNWSLCGHFSCQESYGKVCFVLFPMFSFNINNKSTFWSRWFYLYETYILFYLLTIVIFMQYTFIVNIKYQMAFQQWLGSAVWIFLRSYIACVPFFFILIDGTHHGSIWNKKKHLLTEWVRHRIKSVDLWKMIWDVSISNVNTIFRIKVSNILCMVGRNGFIIIYLYKRIQK